MAKRPVFCVNNKKPYYKEISTDFTYFSGFANSQRQKSVNSLHKAFISDNPSAKILEVSRFSDNSLGWELSAFNLLIPIKNGKRIPVENAFQSGKIFENGGPYEDLLYVSPIQAKKDQRIRDSGRIVGFVFDKKEFPIEPKTFFYDWLYINALADRTDLTEKIINYDAFTDIAFNPEKSINCQARTVAIYVSLVKEKIIKDALSSAENFLEVIYRKENEQLKLF